VRRRRLRTRGRFIFRIALGLALISLAVFATSTGWFSEPRSWQVGSGWTRLPPALKPDPAIRALEPHITWLGHSGFLIEWSGTRLVIDPNLSETCRIVPRLIVAPSPPEGPIDLALISHAHYDHLDTPTLTALNGLTRIAAPAGTDRFLPAELRAGTVFTGMTEGRSIRVGELEVTAVTARHRGGRFHPLPSRFDALGYVIQNGDMAIYYAGDTAFGDHFRAIAARFQPRIAILPIGAFAPRFPLRYHHLSPEEAVDAARVLGVERVVPCHFGTFRLAFDDPREALPRFARAAAEAGLDWQMPQPPETTREEARACVPR